MMELQNFHLVSFRGIELSGVLVLMELQNNNINQLYRSINPLDTNFQLTNPTEWTEFWNHFNLFIQNHARSEGFCNALEAMQVYNYSILDKLLTNDVLPAAEELEIAIGYLEFLLSQPHNKNYPQFLLLNQKINTLEENQLHIIQLLQHFLLFFRQNYLEN